MGRITTSVEIANLLAPEKAIRCNALVDTGASHLTLPTAWRERLGELQEFGTVELEMANQQLIEGVILAPVRIQMEGFRSIVTEVLFVDMEPQDGNYEVLVGYIVLEQSQAAIDMVGHKLTHVKRLDLKYLRK
uniref:Aspartyl protease n=1 Tax=Candidatus Kentrum sp. MB TaxID=2138164 RepID=A0A450Y0H8_9GAMM|nr:MAG: Aspartyl protease [Candidatus Kentron sp. MB]VFK35034.1 MAG: Aspartyl protease [Candidatus Kentron sp. MB]VFK77124.1 MAG: Aspartyl protease [Candidatus Kentron sp. MB]